MHLSFGAVVLLLGLFLMFASQLTLALHAFTGNPLRGLACFLVPLYVYVYARKHKVGTTLMRVWYAGVALLVVGAAMLS